MKLTEQVKGLISRGEIRDASTNLLEDTINAVLGDPISIGKIIIAIAKSPFFIREQLFWAKMETFLNGVYLNEDDRAKLCARLTEDGENQDNALRLVENIDRAETQQKIRYLINATRCLLAEFIDRSTYFRICHALTHTLEEDLLFLREHIKESKLPYSQYAQGLLTTGLMYQSVIDGNGDQKYSFTTIAELVDRYAVSYDNLERYPNPTIMEIQERTPEISIPSLEWENDTSSDEEVDEMLKEIFGE
jgi:hypothetical protein